MRKIFYSIIILILMIACKSTETVLRPKFIAGIENIIYNLENGRTDEFEAYVQTIKFLNKPDTKDKDYNKGQEFLNQVIIKMDEKGKKEFENKNYENSLRYALSLHILGKKSSMTLREVYDKVLEQADKTSDIYTQLDLREEMANLKLLTNKEVFDLLNLYSKNKSRDVFIYLLNKYKKMYSSLLRDYPELEDMEKRMISLNELNLEELMKSVVTVILDKGLDMKKGLGIMDKSIGTGFFIDNNGYILTNHHVIKEHVDPEYEGFSKVYVTLRKDPEVEIPAEVVGFDKVFDIALLKIPLKSEKYLILGRSSDMSVGDKIFTIGNPLGIKYTVTSGIISNKDLEFFQLGRGFMIDAAINPGNSGGPLVDERGQVIGIVFAGIPQYEGINFAIPFQWVRKTIPDLYKKGEVERCWIGAGLYMENDKVYFYYLLPNGGAYTSGIKEGDRLISIDGEEVSNVEDAQSKLAWRRYPGLISIVTERDGKKNNNIVRLEKRPYLPIEEVFNRDTESNIIKLVFGIGMEYYDKKMRTKKYVAKKIYKGKFGAELKIAEGDSITVYDLKYIKKSTLIRLTIRYKQEEIGVFERAVTIASYAEINSLL